MASREILYAFASTNANNGSAFAGLSGNTPWFNTTLGLAMFLGRFAYVDSGAGAGGFVRRQEEGARVGRHVPDGWPARSSDCCSASSSSCTCCNTSPALALGPVVEHFLMQAGKTF